MILTVFRDLIRLARSWWRVDRVRIPPHEGRLLRLEPPCIVVVEDRLAEVLARTTGQSAAGPYVSYECRSAEGECRLQASLVAPGLPPVVSWSEGSMTRQIAPEAVEVYLLEHAGRQSRTPLASRDFAR